MLKKTATRGGVGNLHTKFTAAGIVFDAFVIIRAHTFQYVRFVVEDVPIIEFMRFAINR